RFFMPKTKLQKQEIAQEITDKLGRSKSVVFANYQGLTMGELIDLRQKLAELGAEFTVTKNNLVKIALKNNEMNLGDDKVLEGPLATLFAFDDEINPIKQLTKVFKDTQKGSVKGGFLTKEFLSSSQVEKLAQLPSQDELRAKVVGSLGAPLYGI